MFDTVRAV